jgi:hypothetical protein
MWNTSWKSAINFLKIKGGSEISSDVESALSDPNVFKHMRMVLFPEFFVETTLALFRSVDEIIKTVIHGGSGL